MTPTPAGRWTSPHLHPLSCHWPLSPLLWSCPLPDGLLGCGYQKASVPTAGSGTNQCSPWTCPPRVLRSCQAPLSCFPWTHQHVANGGRLPWGRARRAACRSTARMNSNVSLRSQQGQRILPRREGPGYSQGTHWVDRTGCHTTSVLACHDGLLILDHLRESLPLDPLEGRGAHTQGHSVGPHLTYAPPCPVWQGQLPAFTGTHTRS